MKTRLSVCLAVAALFCCSATAFGQYVQQHPGQQWNNPAIRASIQQPVMQQPVMQQPVMQQPVMQQPVAPVAPIPPVGSGGAYFQQGNCNPGNCNSGCGCDGGYGGCDTGCGGGGYGGCDTGGGCGGHIGGGCGGGHIGGGCGGGHIGGGCGGGHIGGGCGGGHIGGGCGIGGGHLGGGCGIGGGGGHLGGGCGIGGGGGHLGGGCGGGGGCGPYRYFSAFGGYSDFDPLGIDVSLDIPGTIEADASLGPVLDNAYTIGGAIGRKKGCFRQEVEFAYRKASVSGLFLDADIPNLPVTLPPLNLDEFDGSLNNYSFLCNLLWDINCGCDCAVYVGGGVGFGFSELDVTVPRFQTTATVEDSSFVYQGILGISKSVSPKCDLFFEYRYFGTDETSIAVDTPLGGGVATSEITSNNYIGGIRIKKW